MRFDAEAGAAHRLTRAIDDSNLRDRLAIHGRRRWNHFPLDDHVIGGDAWPPAGSRGEAGERQDGGEGSLQALT